VKSGLGKLLLALSSLLLWLALMEGGLRLAGTQPEGPVHMQFSWEEQGELWLLQPNSSSRTRDGQHLVLANSMGLRDREIGPRKTGVARILFLGDSVTFGHVLPIEATFVRQLEREFARRGHPVEVVNAGVYGWSTRQEFLFYQEYGERLEADLVLLGFVLNDVRELKNNIDSGTAEHGLRAINAISWLAERTATAHVVKELYVAVFAPHARELGAVEDLVYRADAPEVARAMDLTKTELGKIAQLARDRGEKFGMVMFPFRFQFAEPGLDRPQRELENFGPQIGIPVLDTLPILRRHPVDGVLMDHDHFTEFGHRLVAQVIADWIQQENLLAPDSPG
jgi:lysophospholipase L1-like esterase